MVSRPDDSVDRGGNHVVTGRLSHVTKGFGEVVCVCVAGGVV